MNDPCNILVLYKYALQYVIATEKRGIFIDYTGHSCE